MTQFDPPFERRGPPTPAQPEPELQPAPPPPGAQWEYKTISVAAGPGDGSETQAQREMVRLLGEVEWDLVAVGPGVADGTRLYFKRRLWGSS